MSPQDPGLQAQRTALSWRRTALAVLANAALMLKAGSQPGHGLLLPLGVALLASSALMAAQGHRRERALLLGEPKSPSARSLRWAAILLMFVAGAGAASLVAVDPAARAEEPTRLQRGSPCLHAVPGESERCPAPAAPGP